MFPIIDKFINESISFLSSLQTAEEITTGCIRLLKGNGINRLSAHEFTHWLGRAKGYLETALKVDQNIHALLKAELNFRKKHIQIPVFVSYGKISEGQIIEPPQIRLLSMQRIEQLIIRTRGVEEWDENMEIPQIIESKKTIFEECEKVRAYFYVTKLFNAAQPKELYVIKNKQDADALTSYLAKIGPILWNEDINCETRAIAACEYLEGFKIDPQSLSLARVGIEDRLDKFDETNTLYGNFEWSYHEAVAIKTQAEEIFILDPASDVQKALSPVEWASIYGKNLEIKYKSALESPDPEQWRFGKYGDGKTPFAVARGEKFPKLQEIEPESYPLLTALTREYVGAGK